MLLPAPVAPTNATQRPGSTAKSTASSTSRPSWAKLDLFEADARRGIGRAARAAGGDSTSTGASSTSNTRRAAVTLCSSVFTMVAIPVICVENCCSRPANTTSCPSVSASRATSAPP